MPKLRLAIPALAVLLGLAAPAHAAPPVLFVDRCAGDCTYTLGPDDVMTYLPGSLPKAFLDETAPCGESQPRACFWGGTTQNSHQRLLATLPEPGASAAGLVSVAGLGLLARGRLTRHGSAATRRNPRSSARSTRGAPPIRPARRGTASDPPPS